MKNLIRTIKTKLVEGDFDVQSESLWSIEKTYRIAEEKVKEDFPLSHPDFPEGVKYSILRNPIPKDFYDNWDAKIKFELEQKGFVKIKDDKNIVELHTPTNKVIYDFTNEQILIFSK
jgi:hypothetical protein